MVSWDLFKILLQVSMGSLLSPAAPTVCIPFPGDHPVLIKETPRAFWASHGEALFWREAGWWLLEACILSPLWHNEARPRVEARARGRGTKVCGEVTLVANPRVPGTHLRVRPGRRNLAKWALKGQNSHGLKALNLSCLSCMGWKGKWDFQAMNLKFSGIREFSSSGTLFL